MPGQFDLGKVLTTVEAIKGAQLRRNIAEMEYGAKQDKVAKEEARNLMAQKYISMGQPEMQGAPTPENLMASEYGGAPLEGAIPPSFDRKAYAEDLLKSGDIEGYQQVESEKMTELKAELDRVAKTYAINPVAGTRMWNDGLLGKEEGRIEHLGVKDGMQVISNPKTGEIVGINKKTYEVKVLREGKPETGDMTDVTKELTARGKIAGLVNKDLQAKWGKTGLVYDKMMEKWIFPPGFDQSKFWDDYNKLESIYQKEYNIKPIDKEPKPVWPKPTDFGKKKGGARPPLTDFDL